MSSLGTPILPGTGRLWHLTDRLKGAVLRSVTTLVLLKDCLKTVSQSTSILVISALSNPVSRITYDGNELTLRTELDSLFDEVMDLLGQTLNCNPNLQVCRFIILPACPARILRV